MLPKSLSSSTSVRTMGGHEMTAADVALAASMILAAFALFFAPEPWGIVGIAQFGAVCALYDRS